MLRVLWERGRKVIDKFTMNATGGYTFTDSKRMLVRQKGRRCGTLKNAVAATVTSLWPFRNADKSRLVVERKAGWWRFAVTARDCLQAMTFNLWIKNNKKRIKSKKEIIRDKTTTTKLKKYIILISALWKFCGWLQAFDSCELNICLWKMAKTHFAWFFLHFLPLDFPDDMIVCWHNNKAIRVARERQWISMTIALLSIASSHYTNQTIATELTWIYMAHITY